MLKAIGNDAICTSVTSCPTIVGWEGFSLEKIKNCGRISSGHFEKVGKPKKNLLEMIPITVDFCYDTNLNQARLAGESEDSLY